MKKLIRQCLLSLSLTVLAGGAWAAPLTWTLADVEFTNGATATGSFVYDADTNTYSDISITTTTDADAAGAVFELLDSGSATDAAILTDAIAHLGEPVLQLVFQDPLTNAGGFVQIHDAIMPTMSSLQGTCDDINCDSATIDRYVVDGGVTTVPVPAAVWLFGSAIALLGLQRRRAGR